ncbi:hypothetical protein [Paenibacillus sp. B1-33]|uniref:hypothetical protein n=1 Tax=unclassified Paenibacillus TaxID=185978 RepID=UPI003D2D8359
MILFICIFNVFLRTSEFMDKAQALIGFQATDSRIRHIAAAHGVLNADYKTACQEVARGGYATDPGYPKLLIDLIDQYGLHKYDQMGKVEKAVIELNGKKVCDGIFANGLVTAPVRVIAEALGGKVGYEGKKATVNGKVIVGSQTVGGTAYAPVREIVEATGGKVTGWDGKERKVIVQK